jgi:hypothetical protein
MVAFAQKGGIGRILNHPGNLRQEFKFFLLEWRKNGERMKQFDHSGYPQKGFLCTF